MANWSYFRGYPPVIPYFSGRSFRIRARLTVPLPPSTLTSSRMDAIMRPYIFNKKSRISSISHLGVDVAPQMPTNSPFMNQEVSISDFEDIL